MCLFPFCVSESIYFSVPRPLSAHRKQASLHTRSAAASRQHAPSTSAKSILFQKLDLGGLFLNECRIEGMREKE